MRLPSIEVNLYIVRAFVKLREIVSENKKIYEKFEKTEQLLTKHGSQILAIDNAIQQLLGSPAQKKRRIGF